MKHLTNDSPDDSTSEIEVYECYVKIDMDGDGVAELRKVIVAGTGYDCFRKYAL